MLEKERNEDQLGEVLSMKSVIPRDHIQVLRISQSQTHKRSTTRKLDRCHYNNEVSQEHPRVQWGLNCACITPNFLADGATSSG